MSHVYEPSVSAISRIPTIGRFLALKWFPSDIRAFLYRPIVRAGDKTYQWFMAVSWYASSFAYFLGSKIATNVLNRLSPNSRSNSSSTNKASVPNGSWRNPGNSANLWGLKIVCKWLIDNG